MSHSSKQTLTTLASINVLQFENSTQGVICFVDAQGVVQASMVIVSAVISQLIRSLKSCCTKGSSATHTIEYEMPQLNASDDWRLCRHCACLFYAGAGAGKCAGSGGGHQATDTGHFIVVATDRAGGKLPAIAEQPQLPPIAIEPTVTGILRPSVYAEPPPKPPGPKHSLKRTLTVDEKSTSLLETLGVTTTTEIVSVVSTLNDLSSIMKRAGLERSNLIFGIDYTASNKHQGELSFHGKSLHSIEEKQLNPYQEVITVLGKTLQPLATSPLGIPAYGFGDVKTSDTSTFPLKSNGHCKNFDELLQVYNSVTPKVILSGPTNFAPVIMQAVEICKQDKDFHILVIIADGQVTSERATAEAIVEACGYPLSIILVGVGDGPWQMMEAFDESLPDRAWDNFHFVNFHEVTARSSNNPVALAVEALSEVPDQYKTIKQLGLLNISGQK